MIGLSPRSLSDLLGITSLNLDLCKRKSTMKPLKNIVNQVLPYLLAYLGTLSSLRSLVHCTFWRVRFRLFTSICCIILLRTEYSVVSTIDIGDSKLSI